MGTRNLTIIVLDGIYKVAKYCQWDGYPSGQGTILAGIIQDPSFDIEQLKKNVATLRFITEEDLTALWRSVGADIEKSDFVSIDIGQKFKDQFPYLGRDCGAKIVELIQKGSAPETKDSLDFAADSLFCEWAYVVDLDHNVIEVYKGFNKKPITDENERFYFLMDRIDKKSSDSTYYPVKFLKTYTFAEFTPKAMKELEESLDEKKED
jgi:hypothetical protein